MRTLLRYCTLVALFAFWTIADLATGQPAAAPCGGFQSGADDWEPICSGTSRNSRIEKYKACQRRWGQTRCSDAYRVKEYYTSNPACCANYLLREGRCVKNGCGGCSNTFASRRACADRVTSSYIQAYVSYYSCSTRSTRCTKTSYRVQNSTQTQYRCCSGNTLLGAYCRKSSTPPGSCGVSKYSNVGSAIDSWIVGGTEARSNEFPWQVSLRSTYSNSHFCGGTIISSTRILTAAHCVRLKSVFEFRVYVGDHQLSVTESTQRIHSAASYVVHQSYSSTTLANDVAIISLATPISFNANVRPACLPTSSSKSYVNRNVIISGWGRTSTNGPIPNTLPYAWVKVATTAYCKEHYRSIGPSVLCVTDNTGDRDKSPCFGDSGGPMVVKEAGKWYLIGVTSFVAARPIGCAGGKPFGYQDVAYHLNWIKARM